MSRAEDLLGKSLHEQYLLEAVVSETSEAFVFAGRDTKGGGPTTVRVARALRGMSSEELREVFDAFAIEAEQLAQITKASSGVEPLLASGELEAPDRERLAFCVFTRTDGSSLAQLRGRGGQSLARVITALEPVANALATAHEQGVAHGDVRPENMILVEAAQRPTMKLVRFTLATRLGTGTRTFAPEYGAPEHFKRSFGDSSIGPPTDVYGLALCIVELVTGRPPLDGSHQTELFKQTTDITRRPTLRARGANVSQAVDSVMARAVAVNPKLRWQNVREFWTALLAAATEEMKDLSTPDVGGGGLTKNSSERVVAAAPASGRASAGDLAPESYSPDSMVPSQQEPTPPPSTPNGPVAPAMSRSMMIGVLGGGFVILVIGVVMIVSVFSRRNAVDMKDVDAAAGSASTPISTASAASSSAAVVAMSASAAAPSVEPAVDASVADAPTGMIRIPPGTFTMGKDSEGKGDRPAHKVTLTHAFYIDRLEVTVEAWNACIEGGACTARAIHVKKQAQGGWGCNVEKDRGKHPANCIDRLMAAGYCAFVKKRLPTEAEWEYAARGSDERDYPWGTTMPTTCNVAILAGMTGGCGDRKGTFPVGTTTEGASPFGALDMGGNVWEWVADDYSPYPSNDVTDPMITLPTPPPSQPAPRGILRGGSWDYAGQSAKTTYRLPFMYEAGNASIGVRCARSVD